MRSSAAGSRRASTAEPRERRVVVGLADPEVQHLELAAVLDDRVERLAQDVGVDQVAFHRDGFLDHSVLS